MAQYDVTLKDYLRILRRRKGIVALAACGLGVFSFAIAIVWQPPPIYAATSKVQINSQQSLSSLYLEAITYNSGDEIETQQAVISSYPVLRRAGDRLGLFPHAGSSEDSTRVVLDLKDRVVTSPEGYTNIIAIEATGGTASQARQLANTLAQVYQEFDDEQRNQQAVRHRNFVESQRSTARKDLADAEDAVRRYREDQDLISLDAQARVILGQITETDDEIQTLRQDLAAVESMVRQMEEGGLSEQILQGASRARVGDSFIALGQQVNSERLERDALLVQYTSEHPSVQRLQVRIDQLQREMQRELEQRLQVRRRDMESRVGRLAGLRQEYNLLPALGLELARLEREVGLRQQVVTVLESEYQTAVIRAADKAESVKVLQWAITPESPTNSDRPLQRAVLGLVLGLIVGVVIAVLVETMDTSIGTIEDVEEYTETKVVGIIPLIDIDEVRASLRRRGADVSDESALRRKAQLVTYFDPLSVLAETYRTLRTNIEFVTVEKGAKTLIITSSMLREGKSTTIANLAMTMAQLGKRTLLVDCDLRKPAVARLFGLNKEPGVTEVIVGNHRWDEVVRTVTDIVTGGMAMEDILQTQGISNLHIITSGAIPPNPAELLNSRRMDEFIADVREAYDVVLFDSPPVLHVTDAAIMGKKVDGAIVIYKAGDIARTSLKQSTNLLKSVQVELLGIVVNGLNKDISSEYHDLGYASYYAYGSENIGTTRSWKERAVDQTNALVRRLRGQEPEAWASTGGVEEEWEEEPESPPSRVVTAALLAGVCLGLLWQSGILQRPLGLMPLVGESVRTQAVRPQNAEPPGSAPALSRQPSPPATVTVAAASGQGPLVAVAAVVAEPEPVHQPARSSSTPSMESPGDEGVAASGEAVAAASGQGPLMAVVAEPEPVHQPARSSSTPSMGSPGDEGVAASGEAVATPASPAAAARAEPVQLDAPVAAARSLVERPALADEPGPLPPAIASTKPAKNTEPMVDTAPAPHPFALRLASYPAGSRWARRLLVSLRQDGIQAFLQPVQVDGKEMERLYMGSFTDWDSAFAAGKRRQGEGAIEEFVIVRLPYTIELVASQAAGSASGPNADPFLYVQQLTGENRRLAAGAFAEFAEAERFLDEKRLAGGRIVMR